MEKWICTVCGYVYDPAIGDSTQEINPGVKFEISQRAGSAQTAEPPRTFLRKPDGQPSQ